MQQTIYFCLTWSHGYCEPRNPISRKEAEDVFTREKIGEGFVILVKDPIRPTAILEYIVDAGNKKGYGIYYFDPEMRSRYSYSFRQIRETRLFLSGSSESIYSANNREPDESIGELYDEEGLVRYSRKRRGEDFRDTWKDRLTTLEFHYEPLPIFGEYDSILRLERDIAWQDQETWPTARFNEGTTTMSA